MLFLADAVWAFLSLTSVSTYWTFNFTFEASSVSSSSILILKCPDVKFICRAQTCRHSLVNHTTSLIYQKTYQKKVCHFYKVMKLGGKHINKKSNTSGENENKNDIRKGTKMSKNIT